MIKILWQLIAFVRNDKLHNTLNSREIYFSELRLVSKP